MKAVTDDAPRADLRMVPAVTRVPYNFPPAHENYIAPPLHQHHFPNGPGKKGRTIRLHLNWARAASSTVFSMTWNVNMQAVGQLAPGTRVKGINMSLGRAVATNATQAIAIEGIPIKDSYYADGTVAPLMFHLNNLHCRDLSVGSNKSMEIADLNCLINNTITVRVMTTESNGSAPDIRPPTAAVAIVLQLDEPDT